MQHIKGPDFPTGGIDPRPRAASATPTRPAAAGSGCRPGPHRADQAGQGGDHRHRAALHGQEGRRGRPDLKIRDLVLDKKIPEISDLRDESTAHGMRLVIELKRDVIPKVVLNKLYKHTPMQTTFGVNMVALVDNVPRTLSLREVDPPLRRPPARGHRPPHEVRAAPRRGARPRARRAADRARQPRRGDRADPRLARLGDRPRRAYRAFELTADPGPGDPRS